MARAAAGVLERRLRLAAQFVKQCPTTHGGDQHFGRAGLAVAPGILAGTIEVEPVVGVLDDRHPPVARGEPRYQPLDQRGLAGARPTGETDDFHARAPACASPPRARGGRSIAGTAVPADQAVAQRRDVALEQCHDSAGCEATRQVPQRFGTGGGGRSPPRSPRRTWPAEPFRGRSSVRPARDVAGDVDAVGGVRIEQDPGASIRVADGRKPERVRAARPTRSRTLATPARRRRAGEIERAVALELLPQPRDAAGSPSTRS